MYFYLTVHTETRCVFTTLRHQLNISRNRKTIGPDRNHLTLELHTFSPLMSTIGLPSVRRLFKFTYTHPVITGERTQFKDRKEYQKFSDRCLVDKQNIATTTTNRITKLMARWIIGTSVTDKNQPGVTLIGFKIIQTYLVSSMIRSHLNNLRFASLVVVIQVG